MSRLLTTTNFYGFNRANQKITIDTGYNGSAATNVLTTASTKSWTSSPSGFNVGPANPLRSMVFLQVAHYQSEPADLPAGNAVHNTVSFNFPPGPTGFELAFFTTVFSKGNNILYLTGGGVSLSTGFFRIPSFTNMNFDSTYAEFTESPVGSANSSLSARPVSTTTYFNSMSYVVLNDQIAAGYLPGRLGNKTFRGFNSQRSTGIAPIKSGMVYSASSYVIDSSPSPIPRTADWSHLDAYGTKFVYTRNSDNDPNMRYSSGGTTIEHSTSLCVFYSSAASDLNIIFPPIWSGAGLPWQHTLFHGSF